jgi:hypothetical protein
MRAMPPEQWGYPIGAIGTDAEARERGVCVNCGAHVPCRIGLATVAGCCSVCGSVGIEPIPRRRYQRGAAPNISPSRPATV